MKPSNSPNPKPEAINSNPDTRDPNHYYQKWYELAKEIILSFKELKPYNVFVFGGRAHQPDKITGDLDIGVWGSKPLKVSLKYEILETFEESIVPFNIDIIDFYSVSGKFKKSALSKIDIWRQVNDLPISEMT